MKDPSQDAQARGVSLSPMPPMASDNAAMHAVPVVATLLKLAEVQNLNRTDT